MTYRGHIKNGVAVLDDDADLPEGAEVVITLAEPSVGRTLSERFADVIGSCPGLPEDMAENHDKHLHGQEGADEPVYPPGSLGVLFRSIAGKAKGLPSDGSMQHDHYIYGTPKIADTAEIPTLSEVFGDLIGSCPNLPEDMAENHDHYLHGQKKR